jgi:endonuclease-8
MEGPSLVIACEEFEKFKNQKVSKALGTAIIPFSKIKGKKFKTARSWGKHFILVFENVTLRIHFLMFGSYRINSERENRIPKMTLVFKDDFIHFYSCAIKVLEEDLEDLYDWSIDLMSPQWKPLKALKKIQAQPQKMVCDVLMDQTIFAGLGNIIKNEVLFNLHLHPEKLVGDLTETGQKALVKEARAYSLRFYKWKKANVLKKNWNVFRKKVCPRCNIPIIKRQTGQGERISHFCESCQK